MSIPRQLVIKQDKACSTSVGTFLRGQARSRVLSLRKKEDGAALWQDRPEVTTTSALVHPSVIPGVSHATYTLSQGPSPVACFVLLLPPPLAPVRTVVAAFNQHTDSCKSAIIDAPHTHFVLRKMEKAVMRHSCNPVYYSCLANGPEIPRHHSKSRISLLLPNQEARSTTNAVNHPSTHAFLATAL